ncbi:P protein-like isoform X3 [Homalodisca vitripennis]|uniref:P protein-like isoform X3 n=1 Tax=Homalodisca vitripennis TaxID=197043 RepID=UPI001EEAE3EA|nr:P protein-like isoform X3 [Homalodisca vitripennis]
MKKEEDEMRAGPSHRASEDLEDSDFILSSPRSNKGSMRGMYDVWNTLPEVIKQDPSYEPFRRYGARLALEDYSPSDTSSASKKRKSLKYGEESSLTVPSIVIDPVAGDSPGSSQLKDDSSRKTVVKDGEFIEDSGKKQSCWNRFHNSIYFHYSKMTILCSVWVFCCGALMVMKTYKDITTYHQISIPAHVTRDYWLECSPTMKEIRLELEGAILPIYYRNLTDKFLRVWMEMVTPRSRVETNKVEEANVMYRTEITDTWLVSTVLEEVIDTAPKVRRSKVLALLEPNASFEMVNNSKTCLRFSTNLDANFAIGLIYDASPININHGTIYAILILGGLYFFIIAELIHRTVAAMLAASVAIAALALCGERPSHQEVVSWVDLETLTLLFAMMLFVAIFSETGIFDYLAVVAYKLSCDLTTNFKCFRLLGGRTWVLINLLCINIVLVSSFLDNVTTILLMTPVTIRLCEVMNLNPRPVLIAMMVFSNIGGAITPIGDPPNVIIASNKDVISAGVTFSVFTVNMGIPLIIIMILVNLQLRYLFRNKEDLYVSQPRDVQDIKHEILIWQRAAASLSSYSKEEDFVRESVMKKVQELLMELKGKMLTGSTVMDTYKEDIEELSRKFPIRDKQLLIKSTFCLVFVFLMFLMQSALDLNMSMGSIALLGAILLLLLDRDDIVDTLARVEWSTLIFFTSLFILMEGLSKLGLIAFIGNCTESVIAGVSPPYRLAFSILMILWVSGIASSILDNIPLTTMMVRIVVGLSQKQELDLPLQPLVWALAIGSCLGGNGTLIAASSNLVCACVAERHGYGFTFTAFSKIGFPVMIWSMTIATVYLMIVYVWLG